MMTKGSDMQEITVGRVSLLVANGDLRRVRFDGVEVLRGVSCPVRDAQWGTWPVVTVGQDIGQGAEGARYLRRFEAVDRSFAGTFQAEISDDGMSARLKVSVALDAPADIAVNRAGLTLLHPLRGVWGQPLRVSHTDGTQQDTVWPAGILPSQPAFDIAGLEHGVAGVRVRMWMTGEVFEMEDQRNWTDASFKTYCRPLGWPLPFVLGPQAPVRQQVVVALSGRGAAMPPQPPLRGLVPQVAVAVQPGLAEATLPFPTQLRLTPGDVVPVVAGPVQLEVVVNERLDGLDEIVAACAGLSVERVTLLTDAYMKSHQPDGPWPAGPALMALVARARAAFPAAMIGGGMFTNFTEFNRCPPDAALVDFVTWSGTAIVHAADDLAVIETLEALPHVFASGQALAGGKPLHLGLFSIGMRSNPYAAACVPNPAGERLAMVRDDPRQATRFAACHAAGALAAATLGRVASLALAMTDGPLGACDAQGVYPVYHVIRFAQAMRGKRATVTTGETTRLSTTEGSIFAVSSGEVRLPAGAWGWLLNEQSETAARRADWLDSPAVALGGARLGPHDMAFVIGDAR